MFTKEEEHVAKITMNINVSVWRDRRPKKKIDYVKNNMIDKRMHN